MKTLNVRQGSQEWVEARSRYFCASDAAAMLGLDKRTTRTELLRMKATGDSKEFSDWVQANLLDRGHEIEAIVREQFEAATGEEFYPVIGVSGRLLASFDGVNFTETQGLEAKSWNEELAAAVRDGDLPDSHWPQVEQEIAVGGLEGVWFIVSDGGEREVRLFYKSRTERLARLRAGWVQFSEDLTNYQHVEVLPAAVAAPVMALPALSIRVNGSLTLIDNLALFGEKLTAFVKGINQKPENDQDFADMEAAVKILQTAQDALEAAEASALAQTATIDEMRRTVAMYKDLARSNRLLFDKIVKARKETIRAEIVQEGNRAFAAHCVALNRRLGKAYLPAIPVDFPGAIRGKKTIASLRDAVSTELARAKIAANEVADRIQINLVCLSQHKEHAFLFVDASAIVTKSADDFSALVYQRITEHQAAEEKKAAELREKIRAEEEAKATAKVSAEAQVEGAHEQARERSAAPSQEVQSSGRPTALSADPPIPPPTAWGIERRPSDHDIIRVLAEHYGVHPSTVLTWVIEMDIGEVRRKVAA